ncbi:flagella synthesis protein FlgN [Psychromonas ossibalaenae]|uniref:flagella synthesis protein FlgN n=1 Tax=Psychromonas ossibalaenae TaxID=444922 RepID=UPI000360D78D|nr:flagellar protein FlgN [Psychromonas ossibalaenae]
MLLSQLNQQLESINNLHAALEEETACLKEKNFSVLNDLLFKKQKLLQAIGELDKVLSTAVSQEKISTDDDLSQLKLEIEKQLQACQKINDINGRLVELSMKSNKHLMQVMTQASGRNSVTYDQKGLLNGGQLLGKNIKA